MVLPLRNYIILNTYKECILQKGNKNLLFLSESKKLLIQPLKLMSLTFLIAGLLALIFEVLFLSDYPHEIYVSRLAATLFAFIVYFATYFRVGKNHPIILTHILLLLRLPC